MTSDGKGGAILNLASIASVIGNAHASKNFMCMLNRSGRSFCLFYVKRRGSYDDLQVVSYVSLCLTLVSIATDYVKQGVRCNCMTPGRIHTPFVVYLDLNLLEGLIKTIFLLFPFFFFFFFLYFYLFIYLIRMDISTKRILDNRFFGIPSVFHLALLVRRKCIPSLLLINQSAAWANLTRHYF